MKISVLPFWGNIMTKAIISIDVSVGNFRDIDVLHFLAGTIASMPQKSMLLDPAKPHANTAIIFMKVAFRP